MEKPELFHNQQLHVLMVSLPYQGHINPMLRFGKILTSKGLQVTLATTEISRSRLAHPDHDPKPKVIMHGSVEFEFFGDGLSPEMDRDKNLGVLLEEYLPTEGARNLSHLISELRSNKDQKKKKKTFSCIIANCFVPWVADVAAEHDIPCAMLWVQACALYAIYYRYHKQVTQFPPLDNPSNVVQLPALPLLQVQDLPSFLLPSGPRHFYNVISSCIKSLDKIQWLFGSSFLKLEQGTVESMANLKPIHPIGPLVPPLLLGKAGPEPDDDQDNITGTSTTTIGSLWETEDSCIEWLDTQPPSSVLYISFGSISVLTQPETEAVAMALETTMIPFLWVMKKGEEGWERKEGQLPKGFRERTKERGRFVSWCNQDQVLMHAAVACFFTHCGWNSTIEAVAAGVPVIAYPDWTDQPTNAKLLVDLFGIGVRVRRTEPEGRLTKDEVERCILEVLHGPKGFEMKQKALEWKEAARKAVDVGGSSHTVIESFIQQIIDIASDKYKN
ncbi:hypothetical protein Dimus_017195 [Dionaea muscipula]